MADRSAVIPGQRVPLVDSQGRMSSVWHRFFVDLHERTGGNAQDKVESTTVVATSAQTTAAAAQSDATDALSSVGINASNIQAIDFLGEFGIL